MDKERTPRTFATPGEPTGASREAPPLVPPPEEFPITEPTIGSEEGPAAASSQTRAKRPRTSHMIDWITDALGDEKAFVAATALVLVALVGGLLSGHVALIASITTLATLLMVFAVQHTSSRESRALNLKMDELIRVSTARNDFIGAEDEPHAKLDERQQSILEETSTKAAQPHSTPSSAARE